MKVLIASILLTLISTSTAYEKQESHVIDNSKYFVHFLTPYKSLIDRYSSSGEIIARLNEYADQVLDNIGNFSVRHGLDPANLTEDIERHFLGSRISLTNGQIKGISTVGRTGDVVVTYDDEGEKKIRVHVPIIFNNLGFEYNFHLKVLLIGSKGEIEGKIKNFRIDIEIEFDFDTYQFKLSKLSIKKTGAITLDILTGHPLTDELNNLLSNFVTTVLHPILTSVVKNVLKQAISLIIRIVNQVIRSIFNPPQMLIDIFLQSLF